MKTKVTTKKIESAIEFESFLRGWEVEFNFNENKKGVYTYTFDDQDDRNAFITEGAKEMGQSFKDLTWE